MSRSNWALLVRFGELALNFKVCGCGVEELASAACINAHLGHSQHPF